MTTQQQQPTEPQTEQQPTPSPEQPTPEPPPQLLDLALRVGRLEGLLEMVIEQQRALGERMDRLESRMQQLALAVMASAIVLAAAIIGGFIALIIAVL